MYVYRSIYHYYFDPEFFLVTSYKQMNGMRYVQIGKL
jgi:hypothetical protein